MTIIRKALIKDCRAVYELCRFPGVLDPDGEPPRMFWIRSFVKEKKLFLVAEENSRVVGFIMGEKTSGNVMLIWLEAVRCDRQSIGIGKKLLQAVEKECLRKKIRVVVVYAYAKNKKMLNLLKSFNYRKGNPFYEHEKFFY